MHIGYVWLIVALSLFIAELLTPGFVLACFGVGALLGGLGAVVGLNIYLQVLFFAVGSIAALFLLRPLFGKISRKDKSARTGVEALLGREARVVKEIRGKIEQGRIAIDGDEWPARAERDEDYFPAGSIVKVTANDSIVMIVQETHMPAAVSPVETEKNLAPENPI